MLAGPAFADGQAPLGYDLSLSQTVEVGGKRGHRVDAAQARVSAAEQRFEYGRLQLAARVRGAYFLAAVARSRVSATREAEEVAADLKTAADDRARATLWESDAVSRLPAAGCRWWARPSGRDRMAHPLGVTRTIRVRGGSYAAASRGKGRAS